MGSHSKGKSNSLDLILFKQIQFETNLDSSLFKWDIVRKTNITKQRIVSCQSRVKGFWFYAVSATPQRSIPRSTLSHTQFHTL